MAPDELIYLDAEKVIGRWAGKWQQARIESHAEVVSERLREWVALPGSEGGWGSFNPTGLPYIDEAFMSTGSVSWGPWVREVASAAKGGRGLPSSVTGQIALMEIGDLIRRERGFSNLWVDDSREVSETRHRSELLRHQLGLGPLITAIWDCWRRDIEDLLKEDGVVSVRLHRLVRLDSARAPGSWRAAQERGKAGTHLGEALPHAVLSAWSTDRKFAASWMPGSGNHIWRALFTADVPRDAIWLTPGFGEAELIVSPVGFGDSRRRKPAAMGGDIVLAADIEWLD